MTAKNIDDDAREPHDPLLATPWAQLAATSAPSGSVASQAGTQNHRHPANKAKRSDNGGMQSTHGVMADIIAAPTTQASVAMEGIKEYILRENLQPGQALPTESRLCAALGVSRSSVREAVRTLVALDIVEVRHGHGMFVGRVSMRPMVESLVFRGRLHPGDDHQGLRDVVEVRATLDQALAPHVIEAWTGRDDEELDAIVEEMDAKAQAGLLFADEDRRFHLRMLEPLDNKLFRHLTDAFWAVHTLTVPLLGAPAPDDILKTVRAHRDMLAAARAGDIEAYRQATSQHYAPLLSALTTG
ncbi:FadR/GntR family transcriptional regulator [Actinomyces slackii]|uniref:L-lactate utilization operon repressor n=2 Tax=Actinomyces slackii TaxID=52774 RepID=A0A448KD00_9ACTO|nr:L-lactate utilization operon repressor [Actinomyces slackii]